MYWMQDCLGEVQDLENLKIDDNVLTATLFRLERYNAQGRCRYTIGEHSLLVHDLIKEPELKVYGLLHDSHEAYSGSGDVSSTTKRWWLDKHGVDLHLLERMIDSQICLHYGLDVSLLGHASIKAADLLAKQYEVPRLYRSPAALWGPLADPNQIDWFTLNSSRFIKLLREYTSK